MTTNIQTSISPEIFNFAKDDYANSSIFFGQSAGLLDTMNKPFPKLETLYKKLKGLDWDEQEFDFEPCNLEFKRMEENLSRPMIAQLGWQWEADSIAARAVSPIMAGFTTSDLVHQLYQRIGDNECLVEGTQVLTPTGWVDLGDLEKGVKVAQYDPTNGTVTFAVPTAYVVKDFKGIVYEFRNHQKHFHQVVTPGHRMLRYSLASSTYDVVTADLCDYKRGAADKLNSAIAGGKLIGGVEDKLTAFERLLIAIQADGSVSSRYDGSIVGTLPVKFGFAKDRKIERLVALTTELGIELIELASSPQKGNRSSQRSFKLNIPVSYAPYLKNYSWVNLETKNASWCKDFLDEQIHWDGHFTKNTGILHTTSREAVEVSQAAAALCGLKTHLAFYPDNRSESFSGCWRLSWKDTVFVSGQTINKTHVEYEGKVRCVTVPTGFFLCRYNDSVSVTGNCIHARAYAEIVKFSFDHPEDVMQSVIQVSQSAQRLETVSKVFSQAYKTSHMLALGLAKRDQETFNVFYMFVVAMFALERLQFMTSFAITFAYGTNGHFMPICKAVQKICQDEYEIHAVAGAHMIDLLSETGEGVMANYQLQDTIKKMIDEIMAVETKWLPFLMGERKDIFGVTERDLVGWNHFCAKDVYDHLRIKSDITFPKFNPLDYMNSWVNISSIQASLQEEKNGQYLLGLIRRDDVTRTFSTDGL